MTPDAFTRNTDVCILETEIKQIDIYECNVMLR